MLVVTRVAPVSLWSRIYLNVRLSRAIPALAGWLDGVEQSLCYCRRHRINPETQHAEFEIGPAGRLYDRGRQQPYTLVNKKLLGRFRVHYAREHRHLESSRKLLAGVSTPGRALWAVPHWPHWLERRAAPQFAWGCTPADGSPVGKRRASEKGEPAYCQPGMQSPQCLCAAIR